MCMYYYLYLHRSLHVHVCVSMFDQWFERLINFCSFVFYALTKCLLLLKCCALCKNQNKKWFTFLSEMNEMIINFEHFRLWFEFQMFLYILFRILMNVHFNISSITVWLWNIEIRIKWRDERKELLTKCKIEWIYKCGCDFIQFLLLWINVKIIEKSENTFIVIMNDQQRGTISTNMRMIKIIEDKKSIYFHLVFSIIFFLFSSFVYECS